MTTKPRFPDTGESDLPRELVDLAQKIADLPEPLQKDLETAYSRVVESVRRRRRIWHWSRSGSRNCGSTSST